MMAEHIDLVVEFTFALSSIDLPGSLLTIYSGGLEMLFSNQRKHNISIPAKQADASPSTVACLITWLCKNLMRDPRKEMFVLDDSVFVKNPTWKNLSHALTLTDGQGYWSSSMTRTGSSRARHRTNCSRMTISSSCLRYMADEGFTSWIGIRTIAEQLQLSTEAG